MKRLRWRRWWIVDGDDPHLHAGPYLTQGAALSAAAKMWHHGWWGRHPRRWVAKDGQSVLRVTDAIEVDNMRRRAEREAP